MKIRNLKLSNKALIYLISGAILNMSGCNSGCINTTTDNEIIMESNNVTETGTEKIIDEVSTGVMPLESVESSSLESNSIEENIRDYEYKYLENTYGYLKSDVVLRSDKDKKSAEVASIKQFEKVKLICKSNGWDYVQYEDKTGYIKDKKIAKILKEFIEVDISEQKLRYYDDDGNVIIKSNIVTGTENHETREGYFEIFAKNTDRYLKGPGYTSYVNYFMPFDGDIGLHDADRWRNEYGGDIYLTNGSHGCVNMPYEKVKKVYEKAKVGTKVLVHI